MNLIQRAKYMEYHTVYMFFHVISTFILNLLYAIIVIYIIINKYIVKIAFAEKEIFLHGLNPS